MSDINIEPEDQAVFDRLESTGRITHKLRRVMTQQWNTCLGCGKEIPQRRPAFAGYAEDGRPTLVGACCSSELNQLATPVYWTGTLNLSIADSHVVWRYMDLAKFVAMLQEGGLYLSRADQFSDPFEGATGLARRQGQWEEFYLNFFRELVVTPPPGVNPPTLTPEAIENEAQRLLRSIRQVSKESRNLLVSCWHGSTGESEALWRLYCPPPNLGVAMRTSVGRLWDAAASDVTTIVGRVHYLDFARSFTTVHKERIFCKRKSLSHENEVRIVADNDRDNPGVGKWMRCDLASLIEAIVISPFAPPWCQGVVADLMKKYDIEIKIVR